MTLANGRAAGLLLTMLVAQAMLGGAAAGQIDVAGGGATPIGPFTVRVESLAERRYRTVLRQSQDLSCGAAAVASLLTHHYGRPTEEATVMAAMLAAGDTARIARQGFSLLDMKRYLASRGLAAEGYRVTLDAVAAAGLPAITLLESGGWRHFVLIKGLTSEEVLVGDPAAGVRVYPRPAFAALWTGIAFVIGDEQDRARTSFNQAGEWAIRVRAPVSAAFGPALSLDNLAVVTGLTAPFRRF